MKSSASPTPRRIQGFTSLELIVGMIIFVLIISAVFSVSIGSLLMYHTDQSRMGVNRNARSSYDLIGNDIREAGERLTNDFPAINVSQDGSGNSVLTLWRGLADNPMPLCAPINVGAALAPITSNNPYKATLSDGSSNLPTACTSSAQDLTSFTTQINAGNTVGYIYNATSGVGSWITVTGVDNSSNQGIRISGLTASYDPRRTSITDPGKDIRIYLMERRQYSVSSGTLGMALNNASGNVATPNVQKFLVQPYLEGNPPTASTYPFPNGVTSGHTTTWRDVAYVDVTLTLSETHAGKTIQRTVTERYNPRNALSGQ